MVQEFFGFDREIQSLIGNVFLRLSHEFVFDRGQAADLLLQDNEQQVNVAASFPIIRSAAEEIKLVEWLQIFGFAQPLQNTIDFTLLEAQI